MPKHRAFGEYGRDQNGQQTRTVHTPGGNTHVGTQTCVTTPNGRNEARLFMSLDIENPLCRGTLTEFKPSLYIFLHPGEWKLCKNGDMINR